MESSRPRFYVVRIGIKYRVWMMTAQQIADRIDKDPSLKTRLDRTIYDSREDAERRAAELNGAD